MIKLHCAECAGSKTQAKICDVYTCYLWPLLPDWRKKRRKKAEKTVDGVQIRMVIRGDAVVEIK